MQKCYNCGKEVDDNVLICPECGALVIDALPHLGSCYISSSMPCDGSVMASSYFARRFPEIPVHHLCFPVRYEDELTLDAAVEDVKACIRFIEKQTGEKWNWDAYFTAMKRFNTETDYELQKWEINKTAYPQLIGPTYELFRKWCYEMDGGLDPRTIKSCEKVNKILLKGYKNKEQAWRNKMRYRAITWSCPPHYYANFSNWLANSWGINVVVEMESLNFTKHLNTSDETEALRDMARLYERMVMRRHTNGGYHNVVTELWRQCEAWNTNIVIMWQHVACKNMATVQGLLDEQGRYIGMFSQRNLLDLERPNVILVDHNERDQAAEGIRSTNIVEIIDHHRIDSVETSGPIYFRNQPLGCTATIITQMYHEKNIEIEPKIAGLLCSAILSDTLMFRSPTCTPLDRMAAEELAKIAGLNIREYASEMFRSSSRLRDRSMDELFHMDFKYFQVQDRKIAISQITSVSEDELSGIRDKMLEYMESCLKTSGLSMQFAMLTNIIEEKTGVRCPIGPYTPPKADQPQAAANVEELLAGMQAQGVDVIIEEKK